MIKLIFNSLLVILYVSLGLLIESFGYTSPPLFAFYGFVMGVLAVSVNTYIEDK